MQSIVGDQKPVKIGKIALVICVFMALTPITALGIQPPYAKWQRLNMLIVTETWQSASQPFYICHGNQDAYIWKDASPKNRIAFLDDSLNCFRLSIDSSQVKLRKWLFINEVDHMVKYWYVEFGPYAFEAGSTHIFHGVWYYLGLPGLEKTTIVHFT